MAQAGDRPDVGLVDRPQPFEISGDAAFEANVADEYPPALAAIGKLRATEELSV